MVVVGSLVNKLGDFNADVICLERLGGCNYVTTLISLFMKCHVSRVPCHSHSGRVIMLVLVHAGPPGGVLSLHHPTDDWSCSGPVSHGRGHSTTTTSTGLAILASPVPIVITLGSQDTGQENINQKKHLGTDDSISQQNC